MSRSSYERTSRTSSSGPVHDRDYDERKERERDRVRSADRYDSENGRHHGKWTASSETEDLESSGLPGAYSDARRSANLGPRSWSDREHYDRDYNNRSRSVNYGSGSYDNYGYGNQYGNQYGDQGYGQSYGSIPTPPPMPPRDFWRPQQHYRGTHPYYAQYGHQSYDGNNYAGMHPQSASHHMFRGTGNFAQDIRMHAPELMHSLQGGYGGYQQSRGLDYGFGSQGFGQSYGMQSYEPAYGHQSYEYLTGGSPYDTQLYELEMARSATTVSPAHLELGTTRPHVDIYELGNEYIIEMDMPGHTRDHIETKLFGNELVITSRPPKRDFKFHINERPLGRHEVTRKFYLPTDVNVQKIGATLTNGVLRVVLPRGAAVAAVPTTTTVIDTTGSTTTTTQTAVVV